ncbi:nitrogen assimilation transcription factor nirA [Penicillium brasilianum]|uniref:Nitrogen assimilation transcription factor nirA n=1 Tax=Penicillium brasilianum TaxID=104259 RepID=A0A1S9RRA0_PENBI|nr:nitrogen assimilation transcription factor nirA [Penicillium brasilianum]
MARACEFCRRRKIRCDAKKPTCSTCRNSSRLCIYQNGPQKQRPSRARIEILEEEKAELENALHYLMNTNEAQRRALLKSARVQNEWVSADRSTIIATPSSQQHFDEAAHHIGIRSPVEQRPLGDPECVRSVTIPHVDDTDEANNADFNAPRDEGNLSLQTSIESAVSPDKKNKSCTTGNDIMAKGKNQASDGIFISTSVVHVSSPIQAVDLGRSHDSQNVSTESLRYQLIANAAMERQREYRLRCLAFIRGIPADLALHLLNLHWSRQHHTFLLTYRPTFMRELEHGGPYCSDLLLYAVFACASKFSERLDVRSNPGDPETAGQHFFTRCDELLLGEGLLIQSSIPTVIALVMLGSTFIARGMTSKGWLYTGYAMRMVYDLGLHIDSQEVNKHNAENIEIRRRVFWGAFVCEKIQSLYLGRPPIVRLQDVHVSQNFLDTFEELEPWEPYNDNPIQAATDKTTSSAVASAYSVTVFQQLCLLSQIMTRIIDKIYFVGATASKTLHEICPLDEALAGWHRDLPAHLTYEPWTTNPKGPPDTVAPNHIIILTTYHALIILLHRPFIAGPRIGTTNHNDGSIIGTSAFSWRRCTTASRNITRLALNYRSIYPLRKSSYLLGYAIYVACTIHVLNTAFLSTGSDRNAFAESSALLSESLRCLDELAVPNSGAADTARIIRKLMAARGVQESPTLADFEVPVLPHTSEGGGQFFNVSPIYDVEQMQPFADIFDPGQDLLFGFMNENLSLANFEINEPSS